MLILLFSVISSIFVSIITCITIFAVKNKGKKNTLQSIPVITNPKDNPITFNNFINNDFAFENYFYDLDKEWIISSIQETIKKDKDRFLILTGKTGLGKTHLLHSIQNSIISNQDGCKTYYVSAENFVDEFVSCIKNRKINDFRSKYRTLDALFIDDFHYFKNKESSQEELFNTLVALQERRALIVISITSPCNLKEDFSERLQRLLQTEITIELQKPGPETQRSVIFALCNKNQIILPDQIINQIIDYDYDIPILIGKFNKLMLYSNLKNNENINISKEDVRRIFDEN